MNPPNTQNPLDQVMMTAGGLEKLMDDLRRQSQDTLEAIRAAREQEEIRFRQAMTSLFQEQQQRTEVALRPKVVLSWQIVAGTFALLVLLLAGGLLLLKQAHDRLRAAQARAEAAEVGADIQQALQHVEITSCGGRPCIRIDKRTPTWKSGNGEYVLVDGQQGRPTGKR